MQTDAVVPNADVLDAIVLAGGRSSRLGSADKATLSIGGHTLLELAVSAAKSVARARACVVVGPQGHDALGDEVLGVEVPRDDVPGDDVLMAREDPAFSGPASAIAAGVALLRQQATPSDATLVLACDMPGIAAHIPHLIAALAAAPAGTDGVTSIDERGRQQPLASLIRTHALEAAIERLGTGALVGCSVRTLFEPLTLLPITARDGATDDIDTWEDARRLGATASDAANAPDLGQLTKGAR